MNFSIRYQRRASNEYQSALKWYGERSELAVINFSNAVKEKIDILKMQPDRFRKTYKEFREVALKKYPYSIVYIIYEEQQLVVISSIFHQKRNPKFKYKNL